MLGVQRLGPVGAWAAVAAEPDESGGSDWRAGEGTRLRTAELAVVAGGTAPEEPAWAEDPAPPEEPAAIRRRSEREAWVVLMGVPGLGPVTFAALVEAFGTAANVLAAAAAPNGEARLLEAMAERVGGTDEGAPRCLVGPELARRIAVQAAGPARILDLVRELDLAVVTLDDVEYPARLRAIELPPPLLFVRGAAAALSAAHAAAVVGTRRPTDKGRLTAGWIASALARAGAVVVSGLAVGIDGAAHAAVVAEGLPTVAVLGGGHARLFPKAHERLADAIVTAGGAVVAELPPDTPASRGTFPRRNRLVSGLSDATVVVEAGKRSGALITAGWALEQGRECLLVPGPLDSPASAGCNAFLRAFPGQTRVVCGVAELLEDLGLALESEGPEEGSDGPPDAEAGFGEAGFGAASSGATGGRRGPSAGRGAAASPSAAAPIGRRSAVLAALAPVERLLAEALTAGPATADELAKRTALPAATILSALTLLELRGLVGSAYGRYAPAGTLARWEPDRVGGRLPGRRTPPDVG
jgi:DNA processing protein